MKEERFHFISDEKVLLTMLLFSVQLLCRNSLEVRVKEKVIISTARGTQYFCLSMPLF